MCGYHRDVKSLTPAHPNLSPFHTASAQLYRLPSLTDRRGRESAAGARGRGGAHGGRPALAPLYRPDPGAASPTRPQAPPPRLVQRRRPRPDPPRSCPADDLSALRAAVPARNPQHPALTPGPRDPHAALDPGSNRWLHCSRLLASSGVLTSAGLASSGAHLSSVIDGFLRLEVVQVIMLRRLSPTPRHQMGTRLNSYFVSIDHVLPMVESVIVAAL
ncbi:uncharacterized protein LOC120652022 [Panicum virgatum]|uniref:uncharacterized protein LOC120652022 n=1 Tax=Panicum virgatum TaxID=38727 RepID=UPI0019D6481B|nr:uncharacterized protein LOC120652022 [Panicum virgatum]